MGGIMDFQELSKRALAVREQYRAFEKMNYGTSWSKEELALGFMGDVGDLAKLVMAVNGRRNITDARKKLAHELSDCLWSVIVLAEAHGIDLEGEFMKTMDDLEGWIRSGKVAG
jgi:NTP pyrophosphatase (non-canonical NTP hydrolase)